MSTKAAGVEYEAFVAFCSPVSAGYELNGYYPCPSGAARINGQIICDQIDAPGCSC